MTDAFKISIIVPIYNVEKYLRNCIDSVLYQTYPNWELILVDDGSPDNCPAICDEYASKDNRIKVIHKGNGGLSSARNAALNIINGGYVFFIDSDDFIHPDTLKDCIELSQKNDADIVQFSYLQGKDGSFPNITKSKEIKYFDNHSIFYSRIQKTIIWNKLYKSHLWENIRMPEGKINEDDATTWKLYYSSKSIIFTNTPYYYYRINPTSIMAKQRKALKIDFIEHYQERISFFEQEGDQLLTDLSKWRFCLPLMLGYMKGNVKKDDLPILLKYFKKNKMAAIKCNKVWWQHRIILAVFSLCPQLFRWIFVKIGKAHTL